MNSVDQGEESLALKRGRRKPEGVIVPLGADPELQHK